MRRIFYRFCTWSLICLLTFQSVSYAETYAGGRTNGLIQYYLDDSAIAYGYAPHFSQAAASWNGISQKVSLREAESAKGADLYMVGNSAIQGLLGAHVPYQKGFLGRPKVASEYDPWQFSAVVLYHNNMQAYALTYQQRVSNAIHEIGHTLGLAHPTQNQPSVMKQGISDLFPTSYDRFELTRKWSGSQSSTEPKESNALRLHANYEAFDTVPDADKNADLIVLASPKTGFDQRKHVVKQFADGKLMDFYTKTPLKISKIIKSDASLSLKTGQMFTVLEPASYLEEDGFNRLLTYENYEPMSEGLNYIVFLKRNASGDYSVMNMSLGTIDTAGPKQLMKAMSPQESAPVDADKSAALSPQDQFITDALSYYNIK